VRVTPAVSVPDERIPKHAERLLSRPVGRGDLAPAFSESSASTAEVLVSGETFYPRMLDDIRAASSSVHVNQFGFRPGLVGDAFADALIAKAAEGVPVRVVVDRRGSDPEDGARAHYERLVSGGVRVWVVRAMQVRAEDGRLGGGGVSRWNLGAVGHIDHRKVTVVDGRIGWVGGAGIEDHFRDGRFHDLFVRVTGPVVALPSKEPSDDGSSCGAGYERRETPYTGQGELHKSLPKDFNILYHIAIHNSSLSKPAAHSTHPVAHRRD
jgi:phosphatidylserine/phosphatidylglycerophosphate/cardiolipin synthase-like enzyme